MDDENDKIRRNLVVASAIIIGTAWLNLSIPDLLERFFSVKSEPSVNLAAWKVWLATLAVLSYLAWRYRWSDEFTKGWADHQLGTEERFAKLVESEYYRDVAKWAVAGAAGRLRQAERERKPRRRAQRNDVHPRLKYDLETALGSDHEEHQRPIEVRLSRDTKHSPTSGSARVHVFSKWNYSPAQQVVEGKQVDRNSIAEIPLDLKRHRTFQRQAWLYAHYNSKASMALMLPIGLALIAGTIVLYRLACSFL